MSTIHPVREIQLDSESPQNAAIAQQIRLQTAAALLPEQDWCEYCTHDEDPAPEPGMPQDIVDRALEHLPTHWDWEDGSLFDVVYLACGHTIGHRVA